MSSKYKYNPIYLFGRDLYGSDNEGSSSDVLFPNKTTEEIFAIANPQIGDAYFNTTEDSVSVYTSLGWESVNSYLLPRIAFETSFENGLDGFIFVNGSEENHWMRGNATSKSGDYSIYITRDNVNPNYNRNNTATVHAYIDILIPNNILSAELSFSWKAEGERNYDYGRIYKAPTSFIPSVNSLPPSSYMIGASQYNNKGVWQDVNIDIPISDAGTVKRFIFVWRNDSNTGYNPAFCVDNVKLTYRI